MKVLVVWMQICLKTITYIPMFPTKMYIVLFKWLLKVYVIDIPKDRYGYIYVLTQHLFLV